MSESPESPVLVRRQGRVGRLTLNRPRVLNALTLDMVRIVNQALADWRDDPSVQAVVLDAAGDRAFCAGGDVRELRRLSLDGAHDAIECFFVEEYAMNLAIARFPKPYISLIDGICMGGGIGISAHGTMRVAAETAVFAMPETIIGMFPDVGGSFVLPRLRGAYGMYLGLTGNRVSGAEATWLGLATHCVPKTALANLADAIAADGIGVIAEAAIAPADVPISQLDVSAFAAASVPEILARLEATGTAWAAETVRILRSVSPTALLFSFEIIRRGAARTLEECQAAELALTRFATRHPDFTEGVRAAAVDKDRNPRWSPATIEEVDPKVMAGLFP